MTEKRECERVSASYDAELRAHGQIAWRRGSVADIGEKGVRIRTDGDDDLAPGTGVWLRIQPREAMRKVVVRGSVVRCSPLGDGGRFEVACEFA